MLKLNKVQCFLFGLFFIFIFYFLNRSAFIFGSEKVTGTFVYYIAENNLTEGSFFYPVIEYNYKDSIYQFRGREGSAYKPHESIPVLLEHKDPNRPMLFTIESFWLYPLFYVILPIIIWAAFSLSYVNKNEIVIINLKYPFFKKEKKNDEVIIVN